MTLAAHNVTDTSQIPSAGDHTQITWKNTMYHNLLIIQMKNKIFELLPIVWIFYSQNFISFSHDDNVIYKNIGSWKSTHSRSVEF